MSGNQEPKSVDITEAALEGGTEVRTLTLPRESCGLLLILTRKELLLISNGGSIERFYYWISFWFQLHFF